MSKTKRLWLIWAARKESLISGTQRPDYADDSGLGQGEYLPKSTCMAGSAASEAPRRGALQENMGGGGLTCSEGIFSKLTTQMLRGRNDI